MTRQRHGEAGEALARTLEALDLQRYAAGGQRLPDRRCWADVEREAARLRAAPRADGAPATGATG